MIFLGGFAGSIFAPDSAGTVVFLAAGMLLYVMSVVGLGAFHRTFAGVAVATAGLALVSGNFDPGQYFAELPTYFGIIAVLLVLSVAGYPIRAERYEAQIRALTSRLRRRGAGVRASSGALGHLLGSVLDVGSIVLADVIFSRAAPGERIRAVIWAARGFSFIPLWANLNLLTATTVTVTGVTYVGLLTVSLPFAVAGLGLSLLVAQRQRGQEADTLEDEPETTLDRGALAVLLYPVLLILTVALANYALPEIPLTSTIAITVTVVVVAIATLATLLLRTGSAFRRLRDETSTSLSASHAEFVIFGSAGILVVSLESLGALAPLGELLGALPLVLVAPALALTIALGFAVGIHVLPMVLLIDTAFPLAAGPAPALWAVAILLGSQSMVLMTPFSNSVTLLSKVTGLPAMKVGAHAQWRFSLLVAVAATIYLTAMSFFLLG